MGLSQTIIHLTHVVTTAATAATKAKVSSARAGTQSGPLRIIKHQ